MYNNDLHVQDISLRRMLDFFADEVRIEVLLTDVYGNIRGSRFQRDRGDWLKFSTRSIDELSTDEVDWLFDLPVCSVEPMGRGHLRIEVLFDLELM